MSGDPASPPCLAGTAGGVRFSGDPADFDQVRRWRDAERERLRAERKAMPVATREAGTEALAGHLDRFLSDQEIDPKGLVVGSYWPIKAEPDLRDWFARLRARGAVMALPVPVSPPQPMTFRLWQDGAKLEKGFGNIPVPPEDAPRVTPGMVFAPLIGWDDAGYRLGYGAGYFDRTLAALTDIPLVLGVGWQTARIATVVPQRHDVPMHAILTEDGLQVLRRPLPLARGWA